MDRAAIASFYESDRFLTREFEIRQDFDLAGATGRLLSSSYVPGKEDPNRGPMIEALKTIFDAYNRGGIISFEYKTLLYYGELL